MNNEVKVQRAWLQELVRLEQQIETSQGVTKDMAIALLRGYVSSAKFILEMHDKFHKSV